MGSFYVSYNSEPRRLVLQLGDWRRVHVTLLPKHWETGKRRLILVEHQWDGYSFWKETYLP